MLFAGTLLFAAGVSLAFFVVVPLALPWLFDFGTTMMIPLITAEEYFSFVFTMVLTFGVSFELPIVVLALSALGHRHAAVALEVPAARGRDDRHRRRVPHARATSSGRRSRSRFRSTASMS